MRLRTQRSKALSALLYTIKSPTATLSNARRLSIVPRVTTTGDIEVRFRHEQVNIQEYVEGASKLVTINDGMLREIALVFRLNHLPPFYRRPASEHGKPFSSDHLRKVLGAIDEAAPKLEEILFVLDFLATPKHDWDDDLERPHRTFFFELVEWFLENLPEQITPETRDALLQKAHDNLKEYEAYQDDPHREQNQGTYRTLIIQALERAELERVAGRLMQLRPLRSQFKQMRLFCRMQMPDAEINILRQGFVLLMTAFDAAIFDLTRIALRVNFFDLIAGLADKEKISLSSLGEHASFEEFRDHTINVQLKRLYVRDLLKFLTTSNVVLTSDGNGSEFAELIELVLRRNVHVHNRGTVDQGYLDHGINPYHLSLSDQAAIDQSYFQRANVLLDQCVERIAKWVRIEAQRKWLTA